MSDSPVTQISLACRPYVSDVRYHCWITEEPLLQYKERMKIELAKESASVIPNR